MFRNLKRDMTVEISSRDFVKIETYSTNAFWSFAIPLVAGISPNTSPVSLQIAHFIAIEFVFNWNYR